LQEVNAAALAARRRVFLHNRRLQFQDPSSMTAVLGP